MTEAAKNKVITEPSLITAKRLTAHQIVVKDTNLVIRMTNDHRMVYSHLEDQFRGLTNPKKHRRWQVYRSLLRLRRKPRDSVRCIRIHLQESEEGS